jgi:hypothetical protein
VPRVARDALGWCRSGRDRRRSGQPRRPGRAEHRVERSGLVDRWSIGAYPISSALMAHLQKLGSFGPRDAADSSIGQRPTPTARRSALAAARAACRPATGSLTGRRQAVRGTLRTHGQPMSGRVPPKEQTGSVSQHRPFVVASFRPTMTRFSTSPQECTAPCRPLMPRQGVPGPELGEERRDFGDVVRAVAGSGRGALGSAWPGSGVR